MSDEKKPQIPVEVAARRSEHGKTYDLGGGRFRAEISIAPIHYKDNYKDEKEAWKDVDLTIVNGRVDKAPYVMVMDGSKVTVTDKKTGAVSVVELLSIGEEAISKSLVTAASVKEISKDVDYDLVLTESCVKFQRTIKTAEALKDATFKIAGDIPVSYHAYDADGDPVDVELTSTKDGNIVESFKIEKDFIKEDGTTEKKAVVYPVKIDPSLTIQPNTKDGHISSSSPTANNDTVLYTYKNTDADLRILVEFSISSVPSGVTIDSATFSLYYTGYFSGTYFPDYVNPKGRNIRLALLRRTDWHTTQVTWNIYKTGSNWGTAGASNTTSDINTSYIADSNIPDSGNNWMNWDVKSMVEQQISSSVSVLGVNGYQTGANQLSCGIFAPRNHATTSIRPKLVIEYTAAASFIPGIMQHNFIPSFLGGR